MAAADLGSIPGRDWVLANPWPWLGAGVVGCVWAWVWAVAFGAQANDGRVVVLAVSLLLVGAAVALRLNSQRPAFLGRLGLGWQALFQLFLAVTFAASSLTATFVLAASCFDVASLPVYPGLALVLWCFVAPLHSGAALQCQRSLRRGEPLSGGAEAAGLIVLAALAVVIGSLALDLGPALPQDWDSMRFFLRSAALAIAVAAPLPLVSTRARRLALSLLILFHFGGICTASLAAPPSPWLITQIWIRIYRPYLEFMYLNNAYHFYAPDPGPSNFVWMRLIYADDKGDEVGVWHKIPRVDNGRMQHSVALEYQRFIAMTEGTVPTEGATSIVVIDAAGQADYAPFFKRRMAAVPNQGIVIGLPKPALAIPFDPLVPQQQQYMAPSRTTKVLLESFARHAASLPHPDDAAHPESPRYTLKRVRIYRVIHSITPSALLAGGFDPSDPTLFRPFYMGEYSPDGTLLDPDEPFLYWLLPIMRVARHDGVELRNYAVYHAGDKRWVRAQGRTEWHEPAWAP